MKTALLALALSAGLLPGAAASESMQTVAAPVMDCDCRAMGQNWRQGAEVCLDGALRSCGMDQNVSTWMPTGKSCPVAFKRAMRAASKVASLCVRPES